MITGKDRKKENQITYVTVYQPPLPILKCEE
jgi:hypothetical protein